MIIVGGQLEESRETSMTRRRIAVLTATVVTAAVLVAPSTSAGAAPTPAPVPQPQAVGGRHAGLRPRTVLRPSATLGSRAALRPHVVSATGPTLSGTVTDTSGDPLAGVTIFGIPDGYAVTDASGRYSMRLPRGHRRVYYEGSDASAPGDDGTGYVDTARSFTIGAKPLHVTATVLATGAAVAGRVVDEQGHALRGAAMAVLPVDQSPPYVDAIDDLGEYEGTEGGDGVGYSHQSGRFVAKGADAGAVLVCFAAQDIQGVPTGGSAGNLGYRSACTTRPVVLVPGRTASVGDLVLPTAHDGLLVGRVTRPDGRPLPYADVSFEPGSSPYLNAETFGQADGSFESPSIPAGRYAVCAFDLEGTRNDRPVGGYVAPCTRYNRVPAGKVTHVAVRMQRGAAGRGTVVDRSGRPLSKVGVLFEGLSKASGSESARTDAAGHYAVSGLPAGRYAVCFESGAGPHDPTGVRSTCAHPLHVTLRAARLTSGISARLEPAGALTGRVTDTAGRAFAHPSSIEVSVGDDEASVKKDGTFFVAGLANGRYRVCASSYGPAITGTSCAPSRVSVVAGRVSGGLHLSLGHARRVVVRATDAAGHPLAGVNAALLAPCTATLRAEGECSTQPMFSSTQQVVIAANAFTDSSGVATMYVPKAGSYSVCSYGYWAGSATDNVSTGYTDACNDTSFGTTIGAVNRTDVAQVLAAGGAVTGQIVDAAGYPVVGARVEISHSGATNYATTPADIDYFNYGDPTVPTPKAEARTDANGRYTIYSVAAGDQQVCASTSKSAGALHGCLTAPVTVTAGSTTSAPGLTVSS
jgi:protocatechuate 3,4-dioxygenase beta subunit